MSRVKHAKPMTTFAPRDVVRIIDPLHTMRNRIVVVERLRRDGSAVCILQETLIARVTLRPEQCTLRSEQTYPIGTELFQFASYVEWERFASMRFRKHGVRSEVTQCRDTRGRVLTKTEDFRRAEQDGTFPVTVIYTGEQVA